MTITTAGYTFAEWRTENQDADEATTLATLHEFIIRTADTWVASGEITAEWANKKLWSLGVNHHIPANNRYTIETTIMAAVSADISAPDRASAIERFNRIITDGYTVTNAHAPYTLTFAAGPEDYDPNAVNPDAPTTVAGTLEKFREIVMLGNVAGPRWDCDRGTNLVLHSFGLAQLPERKTFQVTRPVTAQALTNVEAYDEASALRVAEWRWTDNRKGYMTTDINSDDTVVPEVRES